MRRRSLLLAAPLLALVPACSKTTPPERFPGLSYANSSAPHAVVRESEDMILTSVDRDSYDSAHLFSGHNPLSRRTYHQYKIPAGKHDFYTHYNNRSWAGLDSNSDLVTFSATLLPGRTYTLASTPKGRAVQGPFSNNPLGFNPCLIDDTTKEVVGAVTPPTPKK